MPGEGRQGAVRAFLPHYTSGSGGTLLRLRYGNSDDRGLLGEMTSRGAAISRHFTRARFGGDPVGWLVRGAALSATFAAVIWLSQAPTEAPGATILRERHQAVEDVTGTSIPQNPHSRLLPKDRWEAWLAARQRSQNALTEYAAIAKQMHLFLRQHVAVLRDARRYGSSLLAQQSNAAAAPLSTADTAVRIPPESDAERQRWAFLKGYLARLEVERARLLATHTPAHPEVAQLAGVMAELRSEIRQLEQWLGNQGEFARDGSRYGSSRGLTESPSPHQDHLVIAASRPPVGKDVPNGIAEELPVGAEEAEAFREALRDLAAGEATLSQLLEQAGAAGQELESALRQEESSAAALREAWCDSAERAVSAAPAPDHSNHPATASIDRSRSNWGLRGALAAALSLLSAIAAGWIWSGLRDPEEKPHAESPARRYWRADGAEPLPRPKLPT